jgi:hypothetical protein
MLIVRNLHTQNCYLEYCNLELNEINSLNSFREGEVVDPSLSGSHVIGLKLPYWIKNLMKPLIRRVDPRLVDIFMGERSFRLHPADKFRSICWKLAPRVRLSVTNSVNFYLSGSHRP